MTDELKPNALAKRLDKIAKSGGSVSGLPDNQRQYIFAVQSILAHYRSGKYTRDMAASERKGAQIRFLQRPLIQEDIERWSK